MCYFCESMKVDDVDEREDFISYEGAEADDDLAECNCSARLVCFGSISDRSDRSWYLDFRVDERWDVNVPVTVGSVYCRTTRYDFKYEDGFECSEFFAVRYCPMCGRELAGDIVLEAAE